MYARSQLTMAAVRINPKRNSCELRNGYHLRKRPKADCFVPESCPFRGSTPVEVLKLMSLEDSYVACFKIVFDENG